MDNNLNNGSGIPNVSDIKFDDTPAESFENLYGGQSNSVGIQEQSVVNSAFNVDQISNVQAGGVGQSSPVQNPGVVSNTGVNSMTGSVQSNAVKLEPQVNSINQSVNSSVVNNGVGVQSSVQPEVIVQSSSIQNSGVVSNPSVNPTVSNVQPNVVQSQSQVNIVDQAVSPSVQPNIQGSMITPNSVNVTSNGTDISNVNIDAERMQSIEEQLSKTSQYNPSDFQQEQIVIPTDNQSEKNKSGLTFVVVLFILLGVAVALMPQITKMIK